MACVRRAGDNDDTVLGDTLGATTTLWPDGSDTDRVSFLVVSGGGAKLIPGGGVIRTVLRFWFLLTISLTVTCEATLLAVPAVLVVTPKGTVLEGKDDDVVVVFTLGGMVSQTLGWQLFTVVLVARLITGEDRVTD